MDLKSIEPRNGDVELETHEKDLAPHADWTPEEERRAKRKYA
jgi:hypothetical protein